MVTLRAGAEQEAAWQLAVIENLTRRRQRAIDIVVVHVRMFGREPVQCAIQ